MSTSEGLAKAVRKRIAEAMKNASSSETAGGYLQKRDDMDDELPFC